MNNVYSKSVVKRNGQKWLFFPQGPEAWGREGEIIGMFLKCVRSVVTNLSQDWSVSLGAPSPCLE